ncbi:MAG: hypothetical protein LLG14_27525 [Nocardiaceae bacterium]|nr:hypothetical protein [Nocardiaceae bacterium]
MESYQYLVVTGNPIDGLFFYGPFPVREDADKWAERNHEGQDYWIAELTTPE